MKVKTLERIEVVQTDDPVEFKKKFNEIMEDLADEEPTAKVQPFNGQHVAYIFYTEKTREIDCVADEFHLEGIHYLCGQCSLHDPVEDGRKKKVWCKYADCGMTDVRHEACEMFYRMVKQNEIKPIY